MIAEDRDFYTRTGEDNLSPKKRIYKMLCIFLASCTFLSLLAVEHYHPCKSEFPCTSMQTEMDISTVITAQTSTPGLVAGLMQNKVMGVVRILPLPPTCIPFICYLNQSPQPTDKKSDAVFAVDKK